RIREGLLPVPSTTTQAEQISLGAESEEQVERGLRSQPDPELAQRTHRRGRRRHQLEPTGELVDDPPLLPAARRRLDDLVVPDSERDERLTVAQPWVLVALHTG